MRVAIIIKFIKKLLRRSSHARPVIKADYIIPRSEHRLSKTDISPNALKVLNRLVSSGFQAYLVGGSVRDLLIGKVPKDFDVATNATPNEIRQLFKNGRIIGRRFKLVHIIFYRDIIEVATFRGAENNHENQRANERGMLIRDNVFGSLDDDAWRRDFTINSLYYNMQDGSIIDFTGGVQDAKANIIRMIGDPATRYQEDPVRMLRAIRFAAKLHFKLDPATAEPIHSLNHLLTHISNARLSDEVIKLYQCGESKSLQLLLEEYGLFSILFPATNALFNSAYPVSSFIHFALESTDARIKENKPVTPAFLFAVLLWFPLLETSRLIQEQEQLSPLGAIEKAMTHVLSEQNRIVAIPKRLTQIIREIWLLQFRFSKRTGTRAFHLLDHPRFRAAYDFLALRALAGNETLVLAKWWTTFQSASEQEQQDMVGVLNAASPPKKKRKRKKPSSASIVSSAPTITKSTE